MEVERKPRVGIIGTGWGVRVQVPAFRKAGWDVTALSGRDEAKVRISDTHNMLLSTHWQI
jgi:predicted dehydrogenase